MFVLMLSSMRLTDKEKEFLFNVLDNLTDRTHYCEIGELEANKIAWPLFKKFRLEIKGY